MSQMIIPELFIHFTTPKAADAIMESGVLHLSRTIEDAVYAAPVGGENAPGVQHACFIPESDEFQSVDSNPEVRGAAVLFAAEVDPDEVWPAEAVWNRDTPLRLVDAMRITVEEAESLLDGSAGITDEWAWT